MQQEKDIRDFIREKRLATGKSLNLFALSSDIEPSSLSKIENKQQGMNYKTLIKIAQGFEQKLSEFFKELEDKHFDY